MRQSLFVIFYLLALPTFVLSQTVVQQVEQHSTAFSIRAIDEQTKAEVPAQYRVKAIMARKTFGGSSTPGRRFALSLQRTDTVVVTTTAKGYYTTEEVLFIPCDTCAEYEHLVLLESEKKMNPAPTDSLFRNLNVNDKIRLDNVYFDQSSYILRPESYPQLDKLLNTLRTSPKLVIEIAGHTDNVGDRRLNQALSENRARVITNYLIQRGILADRLHFRGYGDTQPAAPNDNEANRKKNRRVEFTVLRK